MTETQNRVTACLNSALQSFNQNEQYLISRDLSERCICAKFASYLERAIAESEFCEYVVDVEYNRGSRGNEHAAKVLNGHNIVVDLIVHKRGYDEQRGFNNLFCIEMKKAYKRCDLSSDKERLRILTDRGVQVVSARAAVQRLSRYRQRIGGKIGRGIFLAL